MATAAATATATNHHKAPSYLAFNAGNKPYYYFPLNADADGDDGFQEQVADDSSECAMLLPALSNASDEQYLTKEDSLLLERATRFSSMPLGKLPKSSSYDGVSPMRSSSISTTPAKSKNTNLRLDETNCYMAPASSSLCDSESSDSEYTLMLYNNNNHRSATFKECATLDLHSGTKPVATTTHSYAKSGEHIMNGSAGILLSSTSMSMSSSNSSSNASTRRNTRTLLRTRTTCCYRLHTFLTRNWYLSYLVPISILLALIFVAYLSRDYAKRLLYWIETQNPWLTFSLFMLFFILVSFPVVVGYFVLMITSGYLFGFLKGFATVVLGANLGIAIAHVTIRSLRHRIPMQRLIKNETGRAILRVISGPRAFKVVLFTRLTPLPFGLQNAIFGVSSINARIYHSATFLGLLPAQTINVYLGSTLRSMHEVLNNHGTAVTGYISFVVEVICGVGLMFWVVQKARKELSETLISDISNEGKLIDIQV